MKNFIISEFLSVYNETETFCGTAEDIINELGDDLLWEIVHEALEVNPKPLCIFDEDEVEQYVYTQAKRRILSLKDNLTILSKQLSDCGITISTITISLVESTLALLEKARCDSSFFSYTGRFIEECLRVFVEKASWQINAYETDADLIKGREIVQGVGEPGAVLWFGIPEQGPQDPWIITRNTKDLSFWFTENDSWMFISSISNLRESSLIWYTAECCYAIPDMAEIRERCPVELCSSDSGCLVISRLIGQQ